MKAVYALQKGAAGIIFTNDDNSDVFTHIYCSAIDVSFPMPLLILPKKSGEEYVSILSDPHEKYDHNVSVRAVDELLCVVLIAREKLHTTILRSLLSLYRK